MPPQFRVEGRRFKTVVIPSKVHSNRHSRRADLRKDRLGTVERSKNKSESPKEPSSDHTEDSSISVSMDSHATDPQDGPNVPALHTRFPPLQDALETESSVAQNGTIQECLPCYTGLGTRSLFDFNIHGLPFLDREKHIEYLHDSLGDLPPGFVAYDAARPWVLYWSLTGLCLLGEDVAQYRSRVIQTLSPMQNADGGFGSGHGQMAHGAPSYAAILSLAMVGGDESLNIINRKSLWKWLGELKQKNGGFRVCVGGEEDVRGAYCTMTLISLLGLPHDLPPKAPARAAGHTTFVSGLPEYLSRCQTFEGGISSAPQAEAHGAYAFCALACLSMLGPPHVMIPKYLDIQMLISWLSARQYAPEGGFAGRTNKLVDGCYSHWLGGCWPLLEAALNGPQDNSQGLKPLIGSLYNREALIRYILTCCQADTGGLKDKPSKWADAYHSCYTLAGLSSAQHYNYFTGAPHFGTTSRLDPALQWKATETVPEKPGNSGEQIFEPQDLVSAIHPIYAIPYEAAERCHEWSSERTAL